MLISTPLRAVYSSQLYQKVKQRLYSLDHAFPMYATRFDALCPEEKQGILGYEIAEMKAVYEKWSGKSSSEPEDYFPAYCRLKHVLRSINLNQKEIPLFDCKGHVFLNDLEFLCFADLSELLTKQRVLDILGIDLKVLPE